MGWFMDKILLAAQRKGMRNAADMLEKEGKIVEAQRIREKAKALKKPRTTHQIMSETIASLQEQGRHDEIPQLHAVIKYLKDEDMLPP